MDSVTGITVWNQWMESGSDSSPSPKQRSVWTVSVWSLVYVDSVVYGGVGVLLTRCSVLCRSLSSQRWFRCHFRAEALKLSLLWGLTASILLHPPCPLSLRPIRSQHPQITVFGVCCNLGPKREVLILPSPQEVVGMKTHLEPAAAVSQMSDQLICWKPNCVFGVFRITSIRTFPDSTSCLWWTFSSWMFY